MTLQRQEIKERLDAAPHSKAIVDLDEIIEKWVSWKISCCLYTYTKRIKEHSRSI